MTGALPDRGPGFSLALAVILAGSSLLPSSAATAGASSTARTASTGAAPRSGQSLQRVWLVGAKTVWAWTQDLHGGAQGLERSTDGGKDWTDVTPSGMDEQAGDRIINGFDALDTDHAWITYAGVADSGSQSVASTSDGGRHWTVVSRRRIAYGCSLQFVSPRDGWCTVIGAAAGSEEADVFRTEDGGGRWRLVSHTPQTGVAPPGALPFGCDKDIQFVNHRLGWAVFACNGGAAPLYETSNGGRTWVIRDVAPPSGTLENGSGFSGIPVLAGADGAVGYTLDGPTPMTLVYVSTDAGASWHPVTPPGPPEGWLVDAVTPLDWRLVNGDHILATEDGGRSWHTITSNVSFKLSYAYGSPTPPVVDFLTNEVGWIVNTSLWRTTDGGRIWTRLAVPGV